MAVVALIFIAMIRPEYWFLWFLVIWCGLFTLNRIFRGKVVAASAARDKLYALHTRERG